MSNPQTEDGYIKIANELAEALAKIRIPGEAGQVLWVILRKTYGWNRKSDRIPLPLLAEATGLRKPNVVRALSKLITMGVIQKDNKKGGELSIVKQYKNWKPLSKKITVIQKDNAVIQKDNKSLSKKITEASTNDKRSAVLQPPKDSIKDTLSKDTPLTPLPDFLDKELWNEYKKMRVKQKKPMTPFAEKLALGKLEKMRGEGQDPNAVLKQSILSSWQGLFPVKEGDTYAADQKLAIQAKEALSAYAGIEAVKVAIAPIKSKAVRNDIERWFVRKYAQSPEAYEVFQQARRETGEGK